MYWITIIADTPMSLEELHEISPEHAQMADQLMKENGQALNEAHSVNDDVIEIKDDSTGKIVENGDYKNEVLRLWKPLKKF